MSPPEGRGLLVERSATAFTRYRDGDPSLMPALVEEVTPLLWHLARSQGLSRQGAEDVVQQAWLRLVESAEKINDPRTVLKWLMTTTRREAWRVRSRSRRDEPREDAAALAQVAAETVGHRVEDAVVVAADNEVLWEHVRALPERCRHLLRVIAFADRPDYSAIAEHLGMPVGSIGPTRGRCLATLRAALERDPAYETGGLT